MVRIVRLSGGVCLGKMCEEKAWNWGFDGAEREPVVSLYIMLWVQGAVIENLGTAGCVSMVASSMNQDFLLRIRSKDWRRKCIPPK